MYLEEPKVEFVELGLVDIATTSCANNTTPGMEGCIGAEVDPGGDCEDGGGST